MSDILITHEETDARGAFVYRPDGADGEVLASMTYEKTAPGLITVDHTVVDPSLGGQGLGSKLMATMVQYARDNDLKVHPTCPFAVAQFEKREEYRDVLAD